MTTPDLAVLRRLYSEWQETDPYGFRLMPSAEYYALTGAAVNALPALLDAAAERDALAAKVERVRRECLIGKGYAGWAAMSRAVLAILDEEPQP